MIVYLTLSGLGLLHQYLTNVLILSIFSASKLHAIFAWCEWACVVIFYAEISAIVILAVFPGLYPAILRAWRALMRTGGLKFFLSVNAALEVPQNERRSSGGPPFLRLFVEQINFALLAGCAIIAIGNVTDMFWHDGHEKLTMLFAVGMMIVLIRRKTFLGLRA